MAPKIASVPSAPRWRGPEAPGRDLVRYGISIAIAAAFSTIQVFVIPRRLDLTTFGQYRLFLVYVGYLEVLNFGLADGAFLRWAGRSPRDIEREWRVVGRWLLAIQGGITGVAVFVAALTGEAPRLFLIAFATAALFVNAQVLSSYAVQAAGDFDAAGRIAVLAPGLFAGVMLLFAAHTLTWVLAAYVVSLAVAALYAARCVTRLGAPCDHAHATCGGAAEAPQFGALMHTGAPVLGASIAAILSRSVDRILVSLAAPMTSFALYGFAATVMVTANVATQALSRVALSHAARRPSDERASFLGGFCDVIAAGYGAGLAGEPLFEHLVARYLPLYAVALPILRALTIGLPLTVATQVVIVGTLQSYGLVRRQFAVQLCGVTLAVVACGAALAMHAPLWEIAAASSMAAATTFAVAVAIVRRAVPEARGQSNLRFALIVALQSAALLMSLSIANGWPRQIALYLMLSMVPTWFAARALMKHGW